LPPISFSVPLNKLLLPDIDEDLEDVGSRSPLGARGDRGLGEVETKMTFARTVSIDECPDGESVKSLKGNNQDLEGWSYTRNSNCNMDAFARAPLPRTLSGNTHESEANSNDSHVDMHENVIYEGVVNKKGRFNTAFKSRFLVLSKGMLRYYSSYEAKPQTLNPKP